MRTMRPRLVGLAIATALLGVAIGITVVRANPTPDLPRIDAARLLASTLEALDVERSVSGTVETHIDLGLPELPSVDPNAGGSDPLSMLLADQTWRMWSSPDGLRVARLGRFQEQVLAVGRGEAWYWDSVTMEAVRFAPGELPPRVWPRALGRSGHQPPRPVSPGDPLAVSRAVLSSARPYASLRTGTPERVAGRSAYLLELRPTGNRTLVGSVRVAVDARTRVPLRLQVIPRGSLQPAIQIGFTSVSFGGIDPAMFAFDPPPNSEVTDVTRRVARGVRRTSRHGGRDVHMSWNDPSANEVQAGLSNVMTFGRGFGLIVAVRVQEVPEEAHTLLPYAGPLASATLVDRGDDTWIVAGAVTPAALAKVERKLP